MNLKMKKKKFLILLLICLLFANILNLCTIKISNANDLKNSSTLYSFKNIVIDPGHGGMDIGASNKSLNLKESDINLKISQKLKETFLSNGYNVILTRESDEGLYGDISKGHKRRDMKKRMSIINNIENALVISIHLNSCPYTYRKGAIVFYKNKDVISKEFATSIQKELNSTLYNREKEKIKVGDFYILNKSKHPSILIECGFLSNIEEATNLSSNKYLNKLANCIYEGISILNKDIS